MSIKPLSWGVCDSSTEVTVNSLDCVDGPFSVYEDRKCSCCGMAGSVVVENNRGECTYERCTTCGLDKEHPSSTLVFN